MEKLYTGLVTSIKNMRIKKNLKGGSDSTDISTNSKIHNTIK